MPFEDDDHESLDWGDDPRLEDDDREDVVSLEGGDEDLFPSPATQAPVIGKPATPHSSAFRASPPPSHALTINESPGARTGPTMPQTTPKNNASFSSILSKTSSGSNSAAHPTNSSGLSAASHPSLPPKPSEAITLAAEAAISRDFRKRERDQILAPGIASMAPRKLTQSAHDIVDLPPDWEIRTSRSSNETYYFNIRTSETTWARPLAVRPRDLRSMTPPRRVDERDRERVRDNTKDSAERNVTKDRGRERARERERSRSRSLSRDRHRFRETDITRSRAPGWDRYRPEEHTIDAKGRSSEKDRPPKLVPTLSAKAAASLPPRPTSIFENKSTDPPRRASRDRGRDSELKRIPVSKDVDRDSRHWSPARDTVVTEPVAMSPQRGRRDDPRDGSRNPTRDEEHRPVRNIARDASPPPRISVPTIIRPIASRQATSNQSKSHSPRDPEHRLNSRASLSPPGVPPPKRRSPSPDHRTSRRASQSPIPIKRKRAPLPPQHTEFRQKRHTVTVEPAIQVPTIPQAPKAHDRVRSGREYGMPPAKEPPTVPGAPSGPRSDRQVIPQLVTKDASHPDFASQSKPPPSGPSKRILALPDVGDSPKGLPTGPRAKSGVPPSPDTERPLKPSPLPPPNSLRVRSPPSHLVSNGTVIARRNKIEHDRDEAISLREQERLLEEKARASQRKKRGGSQSPPPLVKLRRLTSRSPTRNRRPEAPLSGPSITNNSGHKSTGSNAVPVAKVRPFGESAPLDPGIVLESPIPERPTIVMTGTPNAHRFDDQRPEGGTSVGPTIDSNAGRPSRGPRLSNGDQIDERGGRLHDPAPGHDNHRRVSPLPRRGADSRQPQSPPRHNKDHPSNNEYMDVDHSDPPPAQDDIQRPNSLLQRLSLTTGSGESPSSQAAAAVLISLRDRIADSADDSRVSPRDDQPGNEGDTPEYYTDGPSGGLPAGRKKKKGGRSGRPRSGRR